MGPWINTLIILVKRALWLVQQTKVVFTFSVDDQNT